MRQGKGKGNFEGPTVLTVSTQEAATMFSKVPEKLG